MADDALHSPFARPNSYVGRTLSRAGAARAVAGRGRYTDDISLPRMLHAAFVRSPHAHARILGIDTTQAKRQPGVVLIMTGAEVAKRCTGPWVGTLTCFPGMKSAPQYPMAVDRACWVGEPVAIVVAQTRAQAEDAAERVAIDWQELPAVIDKKTALDAKSPVIHAELGDNLAYRKTIDTGDVEAVFANADLVVEDTFDFGRHTAVSLESRAVLAAYDKGTGKLTIHTSSQCPHMIQRVFAQTLGIPDHNVQIVAPDVGGSFGLKIHTYGDEVAATAAAIELGRPVKFIADRLEVVRLRHPCPRELRQGAHGGQQVGGDPGLRSRCAVGRRRLFAVPAHQRVRGQPDPQHHRRSLPAQAPGRAPPSSISTSRPPRNIAPSATRSATPSASTWSTGRRCARDRPVEIRRRNVMPDDGYPAVTASGIKLKDLSHQRCLDVLVERMGYAELRKEQALCAQGHPPRHRCRLLHQGHLARPAGLLRHRRRADLAAGRLRHRARAQWRRHLRRRCHGAGPGHRHHHGADRRHRARRADGERARDLRRHGRRALRRRHLRLARGRHRRRGRLRAARDLRAEILAIAGVLLQAEACDPRHDDGTVVDRAGGAKRMPLAEIGRIGHFQLGELPGSVQPVLSQTRRFRLVDDLCIFSNGISGAYVEVDIDTGFFRLFKHWVVEDCGRIINPQLADEQVRGGCVQGLGGALYEHCIYDEPGQLINGTMADYLMPMAAEMPISKWRTCRLSARSLSWAPRASANSAPAPRRPSS